jgi:hypothetical protein
MTYVKVVIKPTSVYNNDLTYDNTNVEGKRSLYVSGVLVSSRVVPIVHWKTTTY